MANSADAGKAAATKAKSDKATANKKNEKTKAPNANPALRWQLGGLIAGVIVAIISSTEPGEKVRDARETALG